jgi:hypothetical protein
VHTQGKTGGGFPLQGRNTRLGLPMVGMVEGETWAMR